MKCLLAFLCGSALLTASGAAESTSTTAAGAFLATTATTTTTVATTEWEHTQNVEESGGSERREGEVVEAPSDRLHASGNVTNVTGFIPCSKAGQYCDGHGFTRCPLMNNGKKLQLCAYYECWKGCCCGCVYGQCWRRNPSFTKITGCWSSAAQDRCVEG